MSFLPIILSIKAAEGDKLADMAVPTSFNYSGRTRNLVSSPLYLQS